MASSVTPAPLTGRVAEQAAILELLSSSTGRTVVVLGPAGIGKTRLCSAVADSLARSGVKTARVTGMATDRTIPLLAMRPLIGQTTEGADFTSLIYRYFGLGPSDAGAGDPVLIVDDAHLLDDSSLAVVTMLADAGRVRVLATARTGDDPLTPALNAVLRRDGTHRIQLSVLSDESLATIANQLLGAPLDGRSAHVLITAAAGNPLLLRELIIGARDNGTLVDRGGMWVMDGPIPSTVVVDELVANRLDRVGERAREALELVVLGGQLRLSLLVGATSADGVEELERAGLITVAGQNGPTPPEFLVDVAHPLYRDVLSQRMRALARLRCHRQLAEMADSIVLPSPDEQLQTAVWRLLGGAPMPAEDALVAARHAAMLKDPVLAADLALASYEVKPTAEAAILACWCLAITGRQADAVKLAAEAHAAIDQPAARAALVLRRAEERWWWANDPEAAFAILEQGEVDLGEWADLLRAQRAVFAALDGRIADARALAEPYMRHPTPWVRRTASIGYAFGVGLAGDWQQSVAVSDEAFHDALNDPDLALSGDPAVHLVSKLYASMFGGDVAAAYAATKPIYAFALQQQSVQARAWAALIWSMAQSAIGQPLSAARAAREGELLWADSKVDGLARWCATAVGLAQLDLGDTTAAAEVLVRLDTYRIDGFRLNEPHEARLRAGVLVATEHRADALELLRSATIDALCREAVVHAAECLHDQIRYRLPIAAAHVDPFRSSANPYVSIVASMADATVRADPALLERSAERFQALGRSLSAAEAWAAAAALFGESARADAMRCSAAAASARAGCEGAVTQLLVAAGPADKLSAREREIARLAASGLTNREVAERLVVSERTVESHLYRVFAKLGISARSELTTVLSTG